MDERRSWADLHRAPRRSPATLACDDIPDDPGVYAWYRAGVAVYVGKAASLRRRLWGNHLRTGRVLTGSALRRNVAEYLGYGSSAAIKRRAVSLDDAQLAAVRAWILGCELAWLTCASHDAACALESALKAERRPHLTKM